MKWIYFLTVLSIPMITQSLEYELQYENETVRVSKIGMKADEKAGLHRDEYPRVIIALKGGSITRIEEDGSSKEILFPTGEAVFLEADPMGQLHLGENGKTDLEVIVVELKNKQNSP